MYWYVVIEQKMYTIEPKYPFASSAAKEVASRENIRKDVQALVFDPDGEVTTVQIIFLELYYVRPL